jgi:hypothetical protein
VGNFGTDAYYVETVEERANWDTIKIMSNNKLRNLDTTTITIQLKFSIALNVIPKSCSLKGSLEDFLKRQQRFAR